MHRIFFLFFFGSCFWHYGQAQDHTCVILSDQTVSCWGENLSGQLGIGNNAKQHSPVSVPGLTNIAEISLGSAHTCAINTTGSVWCWGFNVWGQLGINNTFDQNSPVLVEALSNIVEISLGEYHTCARNTTGAIFCWGHNKQGELGIGTTDTQENLPQFVNFPTSSSTNFTQIAVGGFHACAINEQRYCFCWGWNGHGQVGLDPANNPQNIDKQTTPVLLQGREMFYKEVSLGYKHSCIIDVDDDLFCWGQNQYYEIGRFVDENADNDNDIKVYALWFIKEKISKISLGDEQTCAINNTGHVFCWGQNNYINTLPLQSLNFSRTDYSPISIQELSDITDISLGDLHTCATNLTGSVFCWGKNDRGQLGIGSFSVSENVPKFVRSLTLPTTFSTSFTSTISTTFTSTISTTFTSTISTSSITVSTTGNETFPVTAEDKGQTIIIIISAAGSVIFLISVFVTWKYCKPSTHIHNGPFNLIPPKR